MITFYWPWLFILIPAPLLLKWLLSFRANTKDTMNVDPKALKLPTFKIIEQINHNQEIHKPWQKLQILPWFIWLLLVISAAQPLWIDDSQPSPVTGRDLMLLIDVSGSMRQMDFTRLTPDKSAAEPSSELISELSSQNLPQLNQNQISRLEVVKEVASQFIEQRQGDRTGLILFGNRPYLRAALSYDRQAIVQLIQETEIALAGELTAIGDAIGLAIKRMKDLESDSRVIVLLTDGANNEGMVNPKKAAQVAASQGIRIYTIGIGKSSVPGPNPYGIWSAKNAQQFEEAVLKDMAQITGGVYFHALDRQGLVDAYEQLNKLEPHIELHDFKHLAYELFPWSTATALLLSILGILHRRSTRTGVRGL